MLPLPNDCLLAMARLIDLHAIMVDPSEDYRGLLGHFSSDPMDRIVDPFQIAG